MKWFCILIELSISYGTNIRANIRVLAKGFLIHSIAKQVASMCFVSQNLILQLYDSVLLLKYPSALKTNSRKNKHSYIFRAESYFKPNKHSKTNIFKIKQQAS